MTKQTQSKIAEVRELAQGRMLRLTALTGLLAVGVLMGFGFVNAEAAVNAVQRTQAGSKEGH